MAATRKKYTVLVPFPKGGGHWATKGETLELLDVEALALRKAGRIALVVDAEAAAVAVATTPTKKATAKE